MHEHVPHFHSPGLSLNKSPSPPLNEGIGWLVELALGVYGFGSIATPDDDDDAAEDDDLPPNENPPGPIAPAPA